MISALGFLHLQPMQPDQTMILANAISQLRRVEGGLGTYMQSWPMPIRNRRVPVEPQDRAPPLDP